MIPSGLPSCLKTPKTSNITKVTGQFSINIMKHKIEPYSLQKGGYCNDTLTYFADDVQIDVSGEFYVDRDNKLHHTHIFDDGVEMEIVVPYENF